MKKYKIVTLYLSGNGKRILKSGEVVNESELVKQNIPKLLKAKQISLVVAKLTAKEKAAEKEEKAKAKEAADKAEADAKKEADKVAKEKTGEKK